MQQTNSEPFDRGWMAAYQDRCENCPFASSGGMDNRKSMKAPSYIPEKDADEYLRGYRSYCDENYGEGWETAQWGWSHV